MDAEIPRAVVAIGGSLEGFAAIAKLFDHLPARTGLAFVIALGPGADGTNLVDQLRGSREVVVVDAPTPLAAERIYVGAHGCDVELVGGELHPLPPLDAASCSLDRILRSLAEARGPAAIGVVLAGAGFDGSIGIKLVKERGGLTFAQMPGEQLPDEMPRMAVATGMVDFVLPVAEIARRLAISPDLTVSQGEDGLRDLLVLVRVRTGHDFTHYKRATLGRRVARRLQITGVGTLREYVELARGDTRELDALLRDFMISVTNFFRDPSVFALLENGVLPSLFTEPSTEPVRVWIAGCATGEEAYSYAMLLLELRERLDPLRPLQLFATDIDAAALAEARLGRYPETIAADVSAARLERFFIREGAFYRVKREVRELVLFAEHNLLRDAPFSRLDVMSCRNLLIYLDRAMQEHVLRTAHFSLAPERFLVLGSSEHADSDDKLFSPIELDARVFARRTTLSAVLPTQSFRPGWQPLAAARAEPLRGERAGETHQRLVERFAPPSVLVNDRLEVEHVSQRAGRYLRSAAGEPTTDLFQLVLPELRQDLRVAVYEARRSPHVAAIARCQVRLDGEPRTVRIAVHADLIGGHLLVVFEESVDREDRTGAPSAAVALAGEPVVRQLEDELRHARDQLRTTVEQYETLVEELHASNEELQAINEELRSAGEEVEASREETDSVNQELSAVNQELKLRVEEILDAKSDIANLMEASDVGVIFLDRALRIYRFTKRSRDIFNILESDVGRPLADLTSKVDYAELLQDAARTLEDLTPIDREVRGGDDRIYQVRVRPYRALDERIAGLVLTFIDITALRRIEAALRSREAMLEDAARRKNEFIATLAHELRNPLTPLKLGLDIQERSAHEPTAVAAARELMAQQVAQLTRLVDDLLDVSRIENGRLELRVEPGLVLRELVVAATTAVRPIVDELRHRLTIDIPEDLKLTGDRMRLVQVFVNLLTNAAKYTDPGGSIAVTAVRDERTIEIVVADTGIGIAPDILPRVFDVFVQAAPLLTRARGGLGIGLSLVRQVISLHGGTVEAESPGLGRGSRFVVTLPVGDA